MAKDSPSAQSPPSRNPIQRLKRFLIDKAIFPAQDPIFFLENSYPNALPVMQDYSEDNLTKFNSAEFTGNPLTPSAADIDILKKGDKSEKAQVMRHLILEHIKKVHTKAPPVLSQVKEEVPNSKRILQKQSAVAGFSEFDYASGSNFEIIGDKGSIDAFSFQWQGIGKSDIVIVAHFGNADCYQNHMDELKALAEEHKCRVIGFNARGIGLSDGKIEQSLQEPVDDAKKVLEKLTGEGVPLEQIVLKGESIGAAILTVAADQFSEEKALENLDKKEREEPFVFNSRSFSRLDLAAAGFVTQNKYIGRALAAIVRPIMNALDLNLKPGEAFANLRKDRKDYLVVKDDNVIASIASIHKYKPIKEARKEEKQSRSPPEKHKVKVTGNESPHNTAFEELASHKQGPSGSQRFTTFAEKAKRVEPPPGLSPGLPPGLSPGLPPGLSPTSNPRDSNIEIVKEVLASKAVPILPSHSTTKKNLRTFEARMDEALKVIFQDSTNKVKHVAILDNLSKFLDFIEKNKRNAGQDHRVEINHQDLKELKRIAEAVEKFKDNSVINEIKDELQVGKKSSSIHEVYKKLHQANLIESESKSRDRPHM